MSAYLTPEEKSEIVQDLLRKYIQSGLEGMKQKPLSMIQCLSDIGFDECHVYIPLDDKEFEFDVNRDTISSGTEIPSFLNDFPVYMIFEKQNDKILWRVWTYWGEVEFK